MDLRLKSKTFGHERIFKRKMKVDDTSDKYKVKTCC